MKGEAAIIAEFKVDSSEQLAGIENHLLAMEHQSGDRSEHINAAFRAMHSIKGAAHFLGFFQLAKLAHQMETVLNHLRDQLLSPSHHAISALLKGVDRIRDMFEDLEGSNNQGIDRELAYLQSLHEQPAKQARAKGESGLQLRDAEGNPLSCKLFTLQAPPVDQALLLSQFDLLQLAELESLESLNDVWQQLQAHTTLYAFCLQSNANKLRRNLPFQPVVLTCLTAPFAAAFPARDMALSSREVFFAAAPKAATVKEKKVTKEEDVFVHVNLKLLDRMMALTGELTLHRYRLARSVPQNSYLHTLSRSIDRVTGRLQEAVLATRLNSFEGLFARMQRLVRDLSIKLEKPLELQVEGVEQQVDRRLLQRLNNSLVHLIRNACDHGIEPQEVRRKLDKPETGQIYFKVQRHGELVVVEVGDDGRGLDLEQIRARAVQLRKVSQAAAAQLSKQELLQLILSPGFSTAQKVNDISGRGVGLDVVRQHIEELGGSLEIRTSLNLGTRFMLTLPANVVINSVLLFQVDSQTFAVPRSFVKKLVTLYDDELLQKVELVEAGEIMHYQGVPLPLIHLADVIANPQPFDHKHRFKLAQARRNHWTQETSQQLALHLMVLQVGELRLGLVVDKLRGISDLLVEAIHPCLNPIAIFGGSIALEDGSIALQLDLMGVVRHFGVTRAMFERPQLKPVLNGLPSAKETLLFRSPAGQAMALPMHAVRRVMPLASAELLHKGAQLYALVEHQQTFLWLPDPTLVNPLPKQDRWFAILLKGMPEPTAILAQSMLVSRRDPRAFCQWQKDRHMIGEIRIKDETYRVPNPFHLKRLPADFKSVSMRILIWDRDSFHGYWLQSMLLALGIEVVLWDEKNRAVEPPIQMAFHAADIPDSDAVYGIWLDVCHSLGCGSQVLLHGSGNTDFQRWSLLDWMARISAEVVG